MSGILKSIGKFVKKIGDGISRVIKKAGPVLVIAAIAVGAFYLAPMLAATAAGTGAAVAGSATGAAGWMGGTAAAGTGAAVAGSATGAAGWMGGGGAAAGSPSALAGLSGTRSIAFSGPKSMAIAKSGTESAWMGAVSGEAPSKIVPKVVADLGSASSGTDTAWMNAAEGSKVASGGIKGAFKTLSDKAAAFQDKHPYIANMGTNIAGSMIMGLGGDDEGHVNRVHPDWGNEAKVDAAFEDTPKVDASGASLRSKNPKRPAATLLGDVNDPAQTFAQMGKTPDFSSEVDKTKTLLDGA